MHHVYNLKGIKISPVVITVLLSYDDCIRVDETFSNETVIIKCEILISFRFYLAMLVSI